MRVQVDRDHCVGHGVCESLADDLFEVGDDGIIQVLLDPVPAGRQELAEAAVRQCPAQALSLDRGPA